MDAEATKGDATEARAASTARSWSRSLRALHAEMVEAASGEGGLDAVATLAAESLGGPVAIIAPRLGGPWLAPAEHLSEEELAELVDEVTARVADPRVPASSELLKEAPIVIAGEVAGVVALLRPKPAPIAEGGVGVVGALQLDGVVGVDDATVAPHATKVIHLAAMAALTGAVVAEARQQAERLLRGSLLEKLSRDEGLSRALLDAERTLAADAQPGTAVASELHGGTYRLLLRVMASHPEEVQRLYDDTIAPLVGYDEQYRTDLVATLQTYLANNCNMNATAGAVFAHRHTIAYRLERVKELTGLDPSDSEDRERLGLGLKAHQMIRTQLPR
jgi:PucR C-terminal helix-turn-helix domain